MISTALFVMVLSAVSPDGKGFVPTPMTQADLVSSMALAAKSLAEVLPQKELKLATFNYGGKEHQFWNYLPTPLLLRSDSDTVGQSYKPYGRFGVPVEKMSQQARDRMHHLLRISLTNSGYERCVQTMRTQDQSDLQLSQTNLERNSNSNPPGGIGWYHFSLFGKIGEGNWGWRLEGHHFSLNIEVVNGKAQFSPLMVGYSPWPQLPEANAQATKFFTLLSAEQQKKTHIVSTSTDKEIPKDIKRTPGRPDPAGVQLGQLSPAQQYVYNRLIDEFLGQFPDAMVEEVRTKVQAESSQAYFAWYGTLDPTKRYFARLQGPSFLVQICHNGVENHVQPSGYVHCHISYHALDAGTGSNPLP